MQQPVGRSVRAGGLLQQVRKLFERRYELRSRRNVARLLYTETRKRLDKYESILAKKIPHGIERFLYGAPFLSHRMHPKINLESSLILN